MLKTGLATAAKAATAALAAAAAGVTALTKASLESYAEYEQLVGGIETLFKDSSGKVREYAANAYKTAGMSANEYMQTVTSFSASLINSLATSTETATGAVTEATIDSLNEQLEAMQEAQDKNVEAVERANEKEIELIEESYEKQLEDFEKLTDERIKLIDKQYAENMKLVDEEEYRRLQAIQNEIDAINAEQAADDKVAKQRAENEKKAALQEKINTAENLEERQKAQEEYNEYLEDLRQEQIEADRKARISNLKAEKKAIKDEADEKRKALQEQHDKEVKIIRESANIELEERKKAQDKYIKSLKESNRKELDEIKSNNKKKLDEMRAYIAEQSKLVTDGFTTVINKTPEVYEQAAEVANMAITDMADNANKMGSTMESIQNAYQGFAKQNYTMLDNLKLGYGGTKEEMEKLLADAEKISGIEYDISSYNDIINAIHVIQDELGITGTTAKEAGTTIQGSVNSMKAAWKNLVTGLGDENANVEQLMDDLVVTIAGDGTETNLGVMGTVVPRIEVIFGEVTKAIKNKLDEVDWAVEGKKLMTLIGNGIETGIAIMSDIGAKIKEKIDSTDWKQLGKDIATFIKEEIIDTLANIDWEMILDTMRTNYRKNIRADIEVWGGMMDTDVSAALEAFDKMDGGYSDTYTSSSGDTHGGGSIGGGGVRDVNINIYGNTEQTLDQIKKGGQEAAAMLGAQ